MRRGGREKGREGENTCYNSHLRRACMRLTLLYRRIYLWKQKEEERGGNEIKKLKNIVIIFDGFSCL